MLKKSCLIDIPMEKTMQSNKEISILGLTKSGKSTYLAVLRNALEKKKSSWKFEPNNEETIIAMSKFLQRMFLERKYPLKTDDPGTLEFRVISDTYWGFNSGGQFLLKAYDVPGEATKGLNSELYVDFYKEYVSRSSGIIFLLDPENSWLEKEDDFDKSNGDIYYPLFSSILDQIKLYKKGEIFMAFCVTKLDMKLKPHSDFDRLGKYQETKLLAERILGRNTISAIDYSFDKEHLAWFPVSATGYTGSGDKRSTQYQWDGKEAIIKDPSSIEPIGIAKSFEWVLNSIANQGDDEITTNERGSTAAQAQKWIRRFFNGFGD